MRNAYNIMVGKPAGNRPHGRPRRRWGDIITMDLLEIGWGGMDWYIWFMIETSAWLL
jgi:hypothetical protein